jgi:hypothetical protein
LLGAGQPQFMTIERPNMLNRFIRRENLRPLERRGSRTYHDVCVCVRARRHSADHE